MFAAISLIAETMDATAQALVVVQEATGAEAVALDLTTEREFRDREGFDFPIE